MEVIEILSCTTCSRIVDQYTMAPRCKRCGTNRFRAVNPSAYILACWFFNNPKHVLKLIAQDIREKYHGKRS